jgi:hypothetical protein
VGDLFQSGYFSESLHVVETLGPVQKALVAQKGLEVKASPERIKAEVAKVEDLIRWAREMREQDYHAIHSSVFVNLWAAQEAGNENVIAAIVRTHLPSAEGAAEQFKVGRYDLASWPWPEDVCLELAQKLDTKAKTKTEDGGWDACARLQTLFSWLGVQFQVPPDAAVKYNEAALVRNVILHRYGRMGPQDAERVPLLSKYVARPLPITRERFMRTTGRSLQFTWRWPKVSGMRG